MALPSLAVQVQGLGSVSAAQLNTYEQTCDDFVQLRGFIGIAGIQVWVRGQSAPGDGAAGAFYWDASSTAPDDNMNVIQPYGVGTTGAWVRDFISPAFGPQQVIASAATVAIGSLPSNNAYITGTATITSFGTVGALGSPNYIAVFQNALTIEANSVISTPTGSNFTTSPGTAVILQWLGGGWRLLPLSPGAGGSGTAIFYGVATGGPTAYAATITAVPALSNGMMFLIQFPVTNDADPTFALDIAGALPIVDVNQVGGLGANLLPANALLEYQSTSGGQYVLLNSNQQTSPEAPPIAATNAQMEAGTATNVYANPSQTYLHPALPKAWVIFQGQGVNGACTITDEFNVSGVSRTGSGMYTVTVSGVSLTSGFAMVVPDQTNELYGEGSVGTGPTFTVLFANRGGGGTQDPANAGVVIIGKSDS